MLKTAKKGFTLIELLIVIIILTILISIVVGVAYQSNKKRANDVKRKADISSIQKKLEEYFVDKSAYPDAISGLEPNYFAAGKTPTDPSTKAAYSYTPAPSGCTTACTSYTLSATLENSNDNGGAYSVSSTQ